MGTIRLTGVILGLCVFAGGMAHAQDGGGAIGIQGLSAGGTYNWIGQDLQVTVESNPQQRYTMPSGDLNTLKDLFAALKACWTPPQPGAARKGMEMSVRLSFKRNGEPVAAPRMTYSSHDAPDEARKTYRDSVDAALQGCEPLKLTAGLGGAIAGRPIAIRYIENRTLQPSTDRVSELPMRNPETEGMNF